MKSNNLLYSLLGLLTGSIFTYLIIGNTSARSQFGFTHDMMGMSAHMGMSMDDMSEYLQNKTGDEFDRAFLSQMIDHHQGAIDMANLVRDNAKHEELKKMADDIISAQTKEIQQMRQWQNEWGY